MLRTMEEEASNRNISRCDNTTSSDEEDNSSCHTSPLAIRESRTPPTKGREVDTKLMETEGVINNSNPNNTAAKSYNDVLQVEFEPFEPGNGEREGCLLIKDYITGYIQIIVMKEFSPAEVQEIFMNQWIEVHGKPKRAYSHSEDICWMFRRIGIRNDSPSAAPTGTRGVTKQYGLTLEMLLGTKIPSAEDFCDATIQNMVRRYNNERHGMRIYTPAQMRYNALGRPDDDRTPYGLTPRAHRDYQLAIEGQTTRRLEEMKICSPTSLVTPRKLSKELGSRQTETRGVHTSTTYYNEFIKIQFDPFKPWTRDREGILFIKDHYTGHVRYAVVKRFLTEYLVTIFYENWLRLYGIPKWADADQEEIITMLQALEIKIRKTEPVQCETRGLVQDQELTRETFIGIDSSDAKDFRPIPFSNKVEEYNHRRQGDRKETPSQMRQRGIVRPAAKAERTGSRPHDVEVMTQDASTSPETQKDITTSGMLGTQESSRKLDSLNTHSSEIRIGDMLWVFNQVKRRDNQGIPKTRWSGPYQCVEIEDNLFTFLTNKGPRRASADVVRPDRRDHGSEIPVESPKQMPEKLRREYETQNAKFTPDIDTDGSDLMSDNPHGGESDYELLHGHIRSHVHVHQNNTVKDYVSRHTTCTPREGGEVTSTKRKRCDSLTNQGPLQLVGSRAKPNLPIPAAKNNTEAMDTALDSANWRSTTAVTVTRTHTCNSESSIDYVDTPSDLPKDFYQQQQIRHPRTPVSNHTIRQGREAEGMVDKVGPTLRQQMSEIDHGKMIKKLRQISSVEIHTDKEELDREVGRAETGVREADPRGITMLEIDQDETVDEEKQDQWYNVDRTTPESKRVEEGELIGTFEIRTAGPLLNSTSRRILCPRRVRGTDMEIVPKHSRRK
jgi:hypothetical protein